MGTLEAYRRLSSGKRIAVAFGCAGLLALGSLLTWESTLHQTQSRFQEVIDRIGHHYRQHISRTEHHYQTQLDRTQPPQPPSSSGDDRSQRKEAGGAIAVPNRPTHSHSHSPPPGPKPEPSPHYTPPYPG
ncbi:MAG: hypothetical protein HQL52_19680 [Magnetococcales bacterium]|nr:hypothetical protein [Magnetococcales bacterium]